MTASYTIISYFFRPALSLAIPPPLTRYPSALLADSALHSGTPQESKAARPAERTPAPPHLILYAADLAHRDSLGLCIWFDGICYQRTCLSRLFICLTSGEYPPQVSMNNRRHHPPLLPPPADQIRLPPFPKGQASFQGHAQKFLSVHTIPPRIIGILIMKQTWHADWLINWRTDCSHGPK